MVIYRHRIILLLGLSLLLLGSALLLFTPWGRAWTALPAALLSLLGLEMTLDWLRGRLITPAPDYRYHAQDIKAIFQGPPR